MTIRWLVLFPILAACGLASAHAVDIAAPSLDPEQASLTNPKMQERFQHLFVPFRTQVAAMSPDGRYLAYSLREGENLSVVVLEIDHPEKAVAKVTVASDSRSSSALVTGAAERTPARIRWMRWATPTRLVVETNTLSFATVDDESITLPGIVLAFDADGRNSKTLATPHLVAEKVLVEPARPRIPVTTDPFSAALIEGGGALEETAEPIDPEALDEEFGESVLDRQWSIPLSPRTFDFVAGEPDSILIRSSRATKYHLYKANVVTGALRHLHQDIWEEGMAALLTRQGRPRIGVASTMKASFPHHFVCESSRFLQPWKRLDEIAGLGDGPGFSVSPENFFGERAFPIGFDEDPDVLYFASNIGRDTFGVYGLNLVTGQRTGLVVENPALDLALPDPDGFLPESTLVFDRHQRRLIGIRYEATMRTTSWLRPEWQDLQRALEANFPGHNVDILDWDEAGARFLFRVSGVTDPGGFYVFDHKDARIAEFVRCAPGRHAESLPITKFFNVDNPAGGRLTGLVSLPRRIRTKPIPVVVFCQPEPWLRASSDYRGDIKALAEMGMAVVQVNGRGTWGFGRQHLGAVGDGFEVAQVEDILTAVEKLAESLPLDPKRIALIGRNRGAYVALRALQLHPARFRCAVAIDATLDLGQWIGEARWSGQLVGPSLVRGYFGDASKRGNSPILEDPRTIGEPVMLLAYPGPIDRTAPRTAYLHARQLSGALRRQGTAAEFIELNTDFMAGRPGTYSAAFAHIERFLNANIYSYGVTFGEPEVIGE